MVRRLLGLLALVTSNERLEWLVVASVLVLMALALAVGWISLN